MSTNQSMPDPNGARAVLSTGGRALLGGASVAAIIAMVKQLAEARRQQKLEEERQKANVTGNTIVFHLKKKSEACSAGIKDPKVESLESHDVRPISDERQLREVNGRFTNISNGECEKKADYIDNTVGGAGKILAAIGGGTAGFLLVTKIAQKAEQNRLKKQIAAAQNEYLDLLSGSSVKNAEAFSSLFCIGDGTDESISGIEKDAGIIKDLVTTAKGATSGAKNMSSAMLAAYLLMAGGSAWATKKILEKRFDPPEEEEPEKQTRIILKAGSAEIPIEPEHMLATIGIMRDCISDSMSDLEKRAANYGFLDEISNREGGRQFLLDLYAKQNGLNHQLAEGEKQFSVPIGLGLKYSRTIGDVMKNPDKHSDAINAHVMNMMGKDPEGWFKLLGDERNSDIVDLKAKQAIGSLGAGSGFKSWLSRIPFLGDLFKRFMTWYATNSKYGRREVARQSLGQMGVTGTAADSILDRYDFTPRGWSEKRADALNSLIALSAQTKTISDKSNKDILKAIQQLRLEQQAKDKKSKRRMKRNQINSDSGLIVELSPEVEAMLSRADRDKIIKAFGG